MFCSRIQDGRSSAYFPSYDLSLSPCHNQRDGDETGSVATRWHIARWRSQLSWCGCQPLQPADLKKSCQLGHRKARQVLTCQMCSHRCLPPTSNASVRPAGPLASHAKPTMLCQTTRHSPDFGGGGDGCHDFVLVLVLIGHRLQVPACQPAQLGDAWLPEHLWPGVEVLSSRLQCLSLSTAVVPILPCSCRTAYTKHWLTAFTVLLGHPTRPHIVTCCASHTTVQSVTSPCYRLSLTGQIRIATKVQQELVTDPMVKRSSLPSPSGGRRMPLCPSKGCSS
eukprot:GFUD01136708.1.p1 GENE.GFUD01136708.1~~GFUD01136708.1.p1  ORF type:complete len:280 (+),score=39.10 GFUD01136708.1:70-909(+)